MTGEEFYNKYKRYLWTHREEFRHDLKKVIANVLPKVSDEELAVMVSNAMQQDEHIAWDKREIKLLGDMIRAKYEAS